MNAVEIEAAISDLAQQPFDPAKFPYTFLEAFGNKTNTQASATLKARQATTSERNMATAKTATLTFWIEPKLTEALRTAASCGHRSIANMVEVLTLEYCERKGISIPEQANLLGREQND